MLQKFQHNLQIVIRGLWAMGNCLAMIMSYTLNKSVFLAIVHGILSWVYIVYFMIFHR